MTRRAVTVEGIAVGLLTTVSLMAAGWLKVEGFIAWLVVGVALGVISSHNSSLLAVAVGTMLSLPTGLLLGSILFIGDAWFIAMGIAVVLAGAGFLAGRLLRSAVLHWHQRSVSSGHRRGEHPSR